MITVTGLAGMEVLDSRGRPTLKVSCELNGTYRASASVPSGASTGRAEAVELRDHDASRYGGLGCRGAVAAVEGEISNTVIGHEFASQRQLDTELIALDGSPNKARLGANTIVAVSIAFARAMSVVRREPLFSSLARDVGVRPEFLPRPTINLFSGGRHAGGQVAVQDVLMVPLASTMDGCLSDAYAVYQAAASWSSRVYGARQLRADEGGLAPPFESSEVAIQAALTAIEEAGLVPGQDVALAIDVAASHIRKGHTYDLDGDKLDSGGMIDRLEQWTKMYRLASVEDGLADDDWEHWPLLRRMLPKRVAVMGDDLLCTNLALVTRAIETQAADALLLKVNQIGTLTEAADAMHAARDAGWSVTISARSGETEDNWLADLAFGWSADFVKIGSITQSERLAKYNRLLEIERDLGVAVHPWNSIGSALDD